MGQNRFSWLKSLIRLCMVFFSVLVVSAFGDSQEALRRELASLGKEYSPEAFIKAANDGDFIAVKLFLKLGMEADCTDDAGATALMHASLKGRTEMVKILLANKANPNATNYAGVTVLMLHACGAEPRPEVTKLLLDAGAHPNPADPKAVTPLMAAAREGHTNVMSLLIAKGAPVNASDSFGRTALTYAVKHGNCAAAALLLKQGAKSWFADKTGMTPGDYAVAGMSEEAFDLTTSTNVMIVTLRNAGVKFATPLLMNQFADTAAIALTKSMFMERQTLENLSSNQEPFGESRNYISKTCDYLKRQGFDDMEIAWFRARIAAVIHRQWMSAALGRPSFQGEDAAATRIDAYFRSFLKDQCRGVPERYLADIAPEDRQ